MGAKSKIQQYIETEIRPRANAIQKDKDAQTPKLEKLRVKLDEAVKKKSDPALLKLYLKTLEPEVTYAGELVSRASKLLDLVGKLQPDPSLGDDFKAVEQMTKTLIDLEGKLKRNFKHLKEWEDLTNDAIAQNADPGNEFAEEWAVIETLIGKHLANAKWRFQQTSEFLKKANQAVANRDQAQLDQLLAFSAKVRPGNPGHGEVEQQFKKFCAKAKSSGLPKGAAEQLARDLPELKKQFDETTVMEEKIAQNHLAIGALKVKPVDYKKAAAVLKIPNQHMAKLQKALDSGAQMETALDALAKDLKLKTTGKDMMAALKRVKVL